MLSHPCWLQVSKYLYTRTAGAHSLSTTTPPQLPTHFWQVFGPICHDYLLTIASGGFPLYDQVTKLQAKKETPENCRLARFSDGCVRCEREDTSRTARGEPLQPHRCWWQQCSKWTSTSRPSSSSSSPAHLALPTLGLAYQPPPQVSTTCSVVLAHAFSCVSCILCTWERLAAYH